MRERERFTFDNWFANELLEVYLVYSHVYLLSLFVIPNFSDVQYEPWFGSLYTEENISASLLELWKNPPEIDQSLHFPPKNEFIPSDFCIRGANISKNPSDVALPKCIDNQPLMKLWYKADSIFNVPRANTYFLVTVKDGYCSIRNCVLIELFVNLLKDELNEVLYQVNIFITRPFLFYLFTQPLVLHSLYLFLFLKA